MGKWRIGWPSGMSSRRIGPKQVMALPSPFLGGDNVTILVTRTLHFALFFLHCFRGCASEPVEVHSPVLTEGQADTRRLGAHLSVYSRATDCPVSNRPHRATSSLPVFALLFYHPPTDMPNVSSKLKCDTCLERGPTAHCNRGHPCIWCFNRCIICRYAGMPPPGHLDTVTLEEIPVPSTCPSPAPSTLRENSLEPPHPQFDDTRYDDVATPPSPCQDDLDYLATLHDTLRIRGGATDNDNDDKEEPAARAANGAANNDGNAQPAEPSLEDKLLALLEQQNTLTKHVPSLIKKGKAKRTLDDGKCFPA
jgi:hypothetical protein